MLTRDNRVIDRENATYVGQEGLQRCSVAGNAQYHSLDGEEGRLVVVGRDLGEVLEQQHHQLLKREEEGFGQLWVCGSE